LPSLISPLGPAGGGGGAGLMLLVENYMVGIRIIGVRGKVEVSEKLVDLLQDIVRYPTNINVSIIIPKGYKI
ncbi:MAG: hypothetical protein ACTSUQ_05840, partial [Candidatus Freyarchaeota archaeon]